MRSVTVFLLVLLAVCIAVSVSVTAIGNSKSDADHCTTIIVGKAATVDGSAITTHTSDCGDCDHRISKVPAKDYPEGAMRPVFPLRMQYPRYIGTERGESYTRENTDFSAFPWNDTLPMGHIPQVRHTYGYIDGVYGIINEHQLAFGESTCGAQLVAAPLTDGGKALFELSELTHVAMERCKTARCAIELMGSLSEEYGYYGAEWKGDDAKREAGEALTITDTEEAWVFHILADDTGSSAVWVAQKVADDEVSVIANQFVIRHIDPKEEGKTVLYSKNLWEVAKRTGLWKPQSDNELLDFTAVYCFDLGHKSSYANRRVWRVLSLVAPSLNLPADQPPIPDPTVYPFSVKPERKLSVNDVLALNRDHYEGTPFDTTQGLQGGPFGNPNRYDGAATSEITAAENQAGNLERPISMFRTVYSTCTQVRGWLPDAIGSRVWFSQHAPHGAPYIPVYPAVDEVPESCSAGDRYFFNSKSQFWVNMAVANYMERSYLPMIGDVQARQHTIENFAQTQLDKIESEIVSASKDESSDVDISKISDFQKAHSINVLNEWFAFFFHLISKFHDGYRIDDFHAEVYTTTKLFYPKWWLEATGFWTNPYSAAPHMNPSDLVDVEAEGSPVSTPPINGPPSMEAQSSSVKEDAAASGLESEAEASNSVVYSVLSSSLLALVGGAVGFFVARQQYQRKEYRSL